MSIKICFISSHFPQGGAERQVVELIKECLKRGFEVTLFLYQADIIFYKELKELNVCFIVNKKKPSKIILYKWLMNIIFFKKNLKMASFDIIHTYLFYNGLFVRMMAPKSYKGRILYSVRNSYEREKFYYYVDKMLNKWSMNIYNSKKSLDQLIKLPSEKALWNNRIIYNGFDTNRFNSENKVSNKILTFGVVGRMCTQKNQIQLLRVLAEIKRNSDFDFRLYIIGDNNDQTSILKTFVIKNHLTKEVILKTAQKNIEDYYKKFDILVLTSLYEGCPNVLFEALLSKCLCIISEGANSDFFIKDGINGIVYNGSDEMLKIKLMESIDILKDKRGESIILNGYNYAKNNFSTTKMAENYIDIYRFMSGISLE